MIYDRGMRTGCSIAILLSLVSGARADDDIPRVDVEVGKTLTKSVGYATGWLCDDTSFLKADVVTRNDTNYWVVTGLKEGHTTCRVGTDPSRVHYIFELHVVPAKSRR
jgi:hypothetical protein